MSRIRILPYGASNSARDLANSLGGKRLRLTASLFRQRPSDTIINWGRSGAVDGITPTLNTYEAVNTAANKLLSFRALENAGVSIPEFTTSQQEAAQWLSEGTKVVERHSLRGHSGEGINIVEPNQELSSAPLYVKYIPKQQEYRVHVAGNTIIDVQQKRRSRSVESENVNWQVRNLAGGFIFARENVEVPQQVLDQAVAAVEALGLDFGAVDLVYNTNRNTGYVLEINTACGLQGTTLENYTAAFEALVAGRDVPAWDGAASQPTQSQQTEATPEPAPVVEPVVATLFVGTPYEGQSREELTNRMATLLDEAEVINGLLGDS
ncbi:putative Phage protein [Vibrio phage 275E43-1]|nr:putative Phage protein [Vibrio phage 275E43-1]